MIKMIKKSALVILSILKSFFLAITQVAWGLVSLFALDISLAYLSEKQGFDVTMVNKTFMDMIFFIQEHILLFVGVFFILDLYFEIRELKKEKKE